MVTNSPRAVSADQLAAVLSDAAAPRLVFQPIVDAERGVVTGYEALARFDAEPYVPPDVWFTAAARFGVAAQLEARALVGALDARVGLPPNCFLSVNLSPHLLGSPEISRVLHARDLRGVVIELTEHVPYGNDAAMLGAIARLRASGALIALDDAGSGYSGLQQLLAIRPEIVKLDRSLVSGVDADEAKLALVRMLGEFAGQLDAWLLAEGVETAGELAALRRLGVPLMQGWLLGRPAAPWGRISEEGLAAVRAVNGRRELADPLTDLVEDVPTMDLGSRIGRADGRVGDWSAEVYLARAQLPEPVAAETVVAVDEWHRPQALLRAVEARSGGPAYRLVRSVLRVTTSSSVRDVALRAMTRPEATRFDPVLCTDVEGRLLGLVRVERIVASLAAVSSDRALP